MKKISVFILISLSFCGGMSAQNIYQLPNPGFEQWDGGDESEPTHWNTFSSSDGTYSSLASSNHHYRLSGSRPGGTGNYFLTIYTKSIMGIKANGNMTTGRIHAGSMSPSSSDNYNYTQRSNSDHCQPFTATPDSLYVWVSFYASNASSTAQISAVIHGNSDYISPNHDNQPSLYKGIAVAQTTRTTTSIAMSWKQLKVPFVYSGNSEARYILMSMTSNYLAGQGDANDALSIDDIEFIYSAWLTDIKLNGTTIDGFKKGKLNYVVHVDDINTLSPDDVSYTTEVDDATVNVEVLQNDCDTVADIILTVTAEDGTTRKVYNIRATTGNPSSLVSPSEERSIKIYPNPASETLTVETEGDIEIVDMKGCTVMCQNCNGATRIDISHLPKGLYFEKYSKIKIIKK